VLGHSADYQLRFFAPGLGIPEDPVTGSAHALVAPWWLMTLARSQVVGWQPSARRGGMLCESPAAGLVRLTGSGHLLWDGLVNAGGMPLAGGDWSVCKGC
jgi:predicted PhzF superfamily epimerase YddE/YHI9